MTWELDTATIFTLSALMQLGRWKELASRHDELVRSARARGDLYAETHAMLELSWYIDLAHDNPAAARHHLDTAPPRTRPPRASTDTTTCTCSA